jgi:hypothetical protein
LMQDWISTALGESRTLKNRDANSPSAELCD